MTLCFLAAGAAHAGYCTAERLADLAGSWQATGSAVLSEGTAPEPVRCRLNVAQADGGLTSSGLCAAAATREDVSGGLRCNGTNFAGTLFALSDGGRTELVADRSTENFILVQVRSPNPDTGEMENLWVRIEEDAQGRYDVRVSRGAVIPLHLTLTRAN